LLVGSLTDTEPLSRVQTPIFCDYSLPAPYEGCE
jgi:hypothetical protein